MGLRKKIRANWELAKATNTGGIFPRPAGATMGDISPLLYKPFSWYWRARQKLKRHGIPIRGAGK